MEHNVINITIENPTKESFSPYGQLISYDDREPDKSGSGWKCWIPMGMVEVSSKKMQIGLVRINSSNLVVQVMERHETREEMLWPITKPIIQLVGLPNRLNEESAQPRIHEIKAFRLVPGQIIIMSKGTWHSAAYTENDETDYFYAIELSNIPEKDIQPWKAFENAQSVSMVNE